MKLLVAFDGSTASEEMLESLRNAALPEQGEARVMTVGERGLEALVTAQAGAERLRRVLPEWQVEAHVRDGSAARVIVRMAAEWGADLIAVGALGRSALAQYLLGSAAFKVANEAATSVRVCRPGKRQQRILLAYDGLAGSQAVLEEVARRRWGPRTEVVLLVCTGFGAEPRVHNAAEVISGLQAAGLAVRWLVREDDPKRAILAEAAANGVDCIYLGDNDEGVLERVLLGTVAAAVVPRAQCAVEIVRKRRFDAA